MISALFDFGNTRQLYPTYPPELGVAEADLDAAAILERVPSLITTVVKVEEEETPARSNFLNVTSNSGFAAH